MQVDAEDIAWSICVYFPWFCLRGIVFMTWSLVRPKVLATEPESEIRRLPVVSGFLRFAVVGAKAAHESAPICKKYFVLD